MDWYGESARTTIASASSISFATGVVWSRVASDWLLNCAPTTPRPICMSMSALPSSFTSRWRPTVPPAPSRLKTSMPVAISSSSMTAATARAVVSYPLPGELGTMNRSPSIGPSPPLPEAEPPSAVVPQPVSTSPAATAPTVSFRRKQCAWCPPVCPAGSRRRKERWTTQWPVSPLRAQ